MPGPKTITGKVATFIVEPCFITTGTEQGEGEIQWFVDIAWKEENRLCTKNIRCFSNRAEAMQWANEHC